MSFADHQDEPLLVSQVMCVGDSSLLAVPAFPFTDVDAVFGDQFPINNDGIFARRYRTGREPVETVTQVTGRDQLDDRFRGLCFTKIGHVVFLRVVVYKSPFVAHCRDAPVRQSNIQCRTPSSGLSATFSLRDGRRDIATAKNGS